MTASPETVREHFREMLNLLYGPSAARSIEWIGSQTDPCGSLVVRGEGGDHDAADMVYGDLLAVSSMPVSAHMTMRASPDRPGWVYDTRIDEPFMSFFIHLERCNRFAIINEMLRAQGFETFTAEGESLGVK